MKSCKMNSSVKVDRLSVLPESIIDSILTRLPIKEVARTSILSRSWRYKWQSLSKIRMPSYFKNIANAINYIFLVHRGSVDKFELRIMPKNILDCTAMSKKHNPCKGIERWILYLSRNGIKELTINIHGPPCYDFPSCIYSCSGLTCLELSACILKHPPAEFKVFSSMTELIFHRVEIKRNVLENLVNSCPLLRRLTLSEIDLCWLSLPLSEYENCPPSFKINAPNLLMLQIQKYDCYVELKNAPLLESASFELDLRFIDCESSESSEDIEGYADCKLVELLCSMPVLQRLEFHNHTLQNLAVGDIPWCLPSICPIKHLKAQINFLDLQESEAACCIFRSCPFIQHIDLTFYSDVDTASISADGFWGGAHDFCFRFDHLKNVRMTNFCGTKRELKFIESLLANAPVLKTVEFLEIDLQWHSDKARDFLPIVSKLIQLPRISPKAEIILPWLDKE